MKQNRATESELNEKKILERIAQSLREGWQRGDGETWGHVGGAVLPLCPGDVLCIYGVCLPA